MSEKRLAFHQVVYGQKPLQTAPDYSEQKHVAEEKIKHCVHKTPYGGAPRLDLRKSLVEDEDFSDVEEDKDLELD